MNTAAAAIQREAYRQARSIHGGLLGYIAASLGVTLSRVPIPTRRLRLRLYRAVFGTKYPPGLDESETERPLWAYPSLNAVFTRGIKPEHRPIPLGTPQFLCPCDGTVQEVGRVEQGKILTLKGIEYTLASLLPHADTQPFHDGRFAVVLWAPRVFLRACSS